MSTAESEDAGLAVARRFHEVHERLFAKAKRGAAAEAVPWADMPASYQQRLQEAFAWMVREGAVMPGPGLGFARVDHDELPASS